MTGRNHRVLNAGTTFVALTAAGASLPLAAAGSTVSAAAARWPDLVEEPLGLPHRGPSHWPSVQALVLALPVIAAAIWLPVATISLTILAHTITIRLPILICTAALAAATWIGCVLHSVFDAMTVERGGIKLLWPFYWRGIHLMPRYLRVRVGRDRPSEWVFVALWCMIVLSYLYVRYHDQIAALGKGA